jgi:murein DD-endopeptidase MepM/ murein hydrolase activator NlpD
VRRAFPISSLSCLSRHPASAKSLALAFILVTLLAGAAAAFDYARYTPVDLDVLSNRKAPAASGVDVVPARAYRFDVVLASEATSCETRFLKWAMVTSGIAKELVDSIPVSHCLQVKTAKGKILSMFIQDPVAESLTREVASGERLTLFATLIYFSQNGPGVVINEFSAPDRGRKKTATDCGCGLQIHSGTDYEAKLGTPIPVMADGVVVKVEEDEGAVVNTPTAGPCGRYVVVKHTFPNGHVAYSRYAWLGRLVGKTGKPISIGQQVKAKDTIGEVGSKGRFHFEVRPVEEATMDRTAEWSQLYGADPTMEWSRFATVDPAKFDPVVFDGKAGTAANKK